MLVLPYPPFKLNPNGSHGHWASKHKAFQRYKSNCYYLAKQVEPMISMKITFHPSCNRPNRNIDNAIAAFKAGQDGMADAWGVDDSEFEILYSRKFGEIIKNGAVIIKPL